MGFEWIYSGQKQSAGSVFVQCIINVTLGKAEH
jgi:hypothetical protein